MPVSEMDAALDFSIYIAERAANFSPRWVFDRIHEWIVDPTRPRCLLVIGEPGSGKTAISARLTQISSGTALAPPTCPAFSPGFLGACHFCVARAGTWIDPLIFARSISVQLARTIPGFAQALKNAGDRSVNIHVTQSDISAASVQGVVIENLVLTGLTPQAAFNAVVSSPLKELSRGGVLPPIVLLIDGLDESLAHKGDVGILQLLASLDDLPANVRFIVTSRRDPSVEAELHAELFSISDEIYNAQNDREILAYVNARLVGTPIQIPAEKIAEKAERNFQYVTFLMNHLQSHPAASDAIEGLPPGLEPLYRESLARTVAAREWERDYAPVMGLLSVSRESLTSAQLLKFSGLKEREISARLAELQPFIEQSGAPPEHRFFHQSVVDYLRLPQISRGATRIANEFYLPPAEWHERIARFYLPGGPSTWTRWDPYGLRYTASHLAEAARAEHGDNRHDLVTRLVELVTAPQYRARHKRDVADIPRLQRDLRESLSCAALDEHPGAVVNLITAALALAAFREEELRPESVFELAEKGELEQAARRLELFEVDEEWAGISLLVIAWLAGEKDPAGADRLISKVESRPGAPDFLLRLVRACLNGESPPVNPAPLPPPPHPYEVKTLVDWFGGGGDPELVHRVVNESLMGFTGELGAATGYVAMDQAPVLVAFAASQPGGDRYLREYIEIHGRYQYVEYRNRSLSIILEHVLRHPDPAWVREMARVLAISALAPSSLEFRESLPLTILALKAAKNDGASSAALHKLRQDSMRQATTVHGFGWTGSGLGTFAPIWGMQYVAYPPQTDDDSWCVHRRRLAAHAQILASVESKSHEAAHLLIGADQLKRGFAGFQAPACLLLADTFLLADNANAGAIASFLESALRSAHNVQDASFCLRVTVRCNAMLERWWVPFDVCTAVRKLFSDPRDPAHAALHRVGERFHHRDSSGLRIPDEVFSANSLAALAHIHHTTLSELTRLNPSFSPSQILPDGTLINVPDAGFAAWIAARLSAQLLADQTLSDDERLELMKLLVPIASPNPTSLDTVLSRLLLAAKPDDLAMLDKLQHIVGQPRIEVREANRSRLPA